MEYKNLSCSYITAPSRFDRLVEDAKYDLADVEYDTMVGTGMSGSIVIPRLAEELGKMWLLLRKPTDNAHAARLEIGKLGRRWLFVDDFVASGETYQRVQRAVHKAAGQWETELVGRWTYEYDQFVPASGDEYTLPASHLTLVPYSETL